MVKPEFTKKQIDKAGEILVGSKLLTNEDMEQIEWAVRALINWRASHAYPLNTFQATLRKRLKLIDDDALVAQRLKRIPSIVAKLERFPSMKLARMQDIGGLRAVVKNISRVRLLETRYRDNSLQHELVSSKDYIQRPKLDGYRGIHLIFVIRMIV